MNFKTPLYTSMRLASDICIFLNKKYNPSLSSLVSVCALGNSEEFIELPTAFGGFELPQGLSLCDNEAH